MNRFYHSIFYILFVAHGISAQQPVPVLSPVEAVRIALENNYDIRLSRIDVDIAHKNNTKANAGMLPVVNLVGNENFTISTFQQRLATGDEINALGAYFNNFTAGVQLSWTLFDGRRMYIVKKRLEQQEALSNLNLQNAVQQTSGAVLQTYYSIARGRLQERALKEVIDLNAERLRIAEARLAAGFAAQTDALQARIDLNQRRADLLTQQTDIETAKRTLNRLLARAPETPFEVEENLGDTYRPERESLLQKIQSQNPGLVSLQKNAEIAALLVDENRTLNKPRIVGISQLNTLRTDNGAGFFRSNTQAGLVVGGSFVMPLYTGGNLRRQVETAQLAAQQSALRIDAQRQLLATELDNQLAFFAAQQQQLSLEEENVKNARESLNVSTERFRLGQTNALEVQNAQNTLEQTLARRNLLLFNLKTTEIALKLLAGEL